MEKHHGTTLKINTTGLKGDANNPETIVAEGRGETFGITNFGDSRISLAESEKSPLLQLKSGDPIVQSNDDYTFFKRLLKDNDVAFRVDGNTLFRGASLEARAATAVKATVIFQPPYFEAPSFRKLKRSCRSSISITYSSSVESASTLGGKVRSQKTTPSVKPN